MIGGVTILPGGANPFAGWLETAVAFLRLRFYFRAGTTRGRVRVVVT